MRLSLITPADPCLSGPALSRIIVRPKSGGVEQNAQDLEIGLSCPASQKEERDEHHEPAAQAAEKIESGFSHDRHRKNNLRSAAPDRERFIDGRIIRMKSWLVRDEALPSGRRGRPLSRKQSAHKVHRSDGHAQAEENSRHHALGFALPESKHESADDNGDQAQAPRNRAHESGL